MANTTTTTKLHIVVFPWLAFGHLLPFLEFSKALARKGHRVSFISTPRNIHRLPSLPHDLLPLIHFVPFPLPPTDGLPATAEATTDLPPHQIPYLKKAFDGLASPFTDFIQSVSPKPNSIILDFSHHWLPPIAAELGVPCIFFNILPASILVFFGSPDVLRARSAAPKVEHFTSPPEWVTFPSRVAYRLHETRWVLGAFEPNASGISDVTRLLLTIERCIAVAIRTCSEFESQWLNLLPQLYQKPVVPVGFLPQPPPEAAPDGFASKIMEWLDRQVTKSVLYVAFGSEAAISTKSLQKLALGLELSQVPFLWALRKPAGTPDGVEILPEGFEERTAERGVVAMGWVPQLKVLAHVSVGGFLTHCGSGSVIEGLQFGHPLVLFPVFADQGLIARVMEERRLGVEVERDEEDGSFTSDAVAKAVRVVMVEDEGATVREKAGEMREVFHEEHHERYVDCFLQFLVELSSEKKLLLPHTNLLRTPTSSS